MARPRAARRGDDGGPGHDQPGARSPAARHGLGEPAPPGARAGALTAAGERYAARRAALLAALAAEGLYGHGRSGLNVWIPVAEEVPVVQGLAELGWAVQAGEPFRLASGPGIRVTVGGLPEDRAVDLASDLGAVLDQRLGSRRG